MPVLSKLALASFFATLSLVSIQDAAAEEIVNIYSYRQPALIEPVLSAFTAKTGIKTNVLFLDKGLEERVSAEGDNSPADVILTVDIARLANVKSKGIAQAVKDADIDAAIPAEYRDPDGFWFGLTKRARVVYASKDRVAQNEITYEELADPKWKGKICIRSGQHDYNLALISSMIANHSPVEAEKWLTGVKDNLTGKPEGGDRDQAKAIHSGACDIGIGNTYYVGQMMTNQKEPEQQDWAKSIKVLFPNASGRGTHVNISGMAMAAHAPNAGNALKLMKFLAGSEAQQLYAKKVFEYPVDSRFKPDQLVASWGDLKADPLPLSKIAENRKLASEMVERVGFDEGPGS